MQAEKTSLGGVLRRERGERTIPQAADLLGVNKNTLGAYERGERLPDVEFLVRFSEAIGGNALELLALRLEESESAGARDLANTLRFQMVSEVMEAAVGHKILGRREATGGSYSPSSRSLSAAPETSSADNLEKDFVLIPRLSVEASAGPGALAERENVLDHMAFRADWLRRTLGTDPRNLVLITAIGDSMEPAIRAGDLLLIDTSVDRITNDAIYVLVRGGDTVVKRVQTFFGGAVTVRSDNPAYLDETLDRAAVNDMRVAGRVRWIARMI